MWVTVLPLVCVRFKQQSEITKSVMLVTVVKALETETSVTHLENRTVWCAMRWVERALFKHVLCKSARFYLIPNFDVVTLQELIQIEIACAVVEIRPVALFLGWQVRCHFLEIFVRCHLYVFWYS